MGDWLRKRSPGFSCMHSPMPSFYQCFRSFRRHNRHKCFFDLPLFFYTVNALPVIVCNACKVCCPKGGRLSNFRPDDTCLEKIGLELHEIVVDSCSSVHPPFFDLEPRILFHCLKNLQGLKSNTVERCSGNVC